MSTHVEEAFLAGWAVYGSSLTDKALEAIQTAQDADATHGPISLRAVAQGAKEMALLTTVEQRRASLGSHWMDQAAAFTPKVARKFPHKKYVEVLKDSLAEDMTTDQRKKARDAAYAALGVILEENPKLLASWRKLVSTARAEAGAEGAAEGTALVSELYQSGPIDIDKAYQAALKVLKASSGFSDEADAWIARQLAGMAGDVASAVSKGIEDGLSDRQLATVARSAVADGEGAQFYMDESVHAAVQTGALLIYDQAGVTLCNFTTEGDGKVCQTCEDLESENPWGLSEVPDVPAHGGCRCFIIPIAGEAPE